LVRGARGSLEDAARFFAYAITYAGKADFALVASVYTEDDMRAALDNAPPRIIPLERWAQWQRKLGREAVPPMPKRHVNEGRER
jgi:hypothetical protein